MKDEINMNTLHPKLSFINGGPCIIAGFDENDSKQKVMFPYHSQILIESAIGIN